MLICHKNNTQNTHVIYTWCLNNWFISCIYIHHIYRLYHIHTPPIYTDITVQSVYVDMFWNWLQLHVSYSFSRSPYKPSNETSNDITKSRASNRWISERYSAFEWSRNTKSMGRGSCDLRIPPKFCQTTSSVLIMNKFHNLHTFFLTSIMFHYEMCHICLGWMKFNQLNLIPTKWLHTFQLPLQHHNVGKPCMPWIFELTVTLQRKFIYSVSHIIFGIMNRHIPYIYIDIFLFWSFLYVWSS